MDYSPVALWIKDQEGVYLFANHYFEKELLGRQAGATQGQTDADLFAEAEAKEAEQAAETAPAEAGETEAAEA